MYETCVTASEAAYLLRHRHGLPVELFAGHVLVTCNSQLGAVRMPSGLGRRVLPGLIHDRPVPAVANPRETHWTLLVDPRPPISVESNHEAQLSKYDVALLQHGYRVWLPTSDTGIGWHWITEPAPSPLLLPPLPSVLSTIYRLLKQAAIP